MKKFLHNNGLSLVLAVLFLTFWACQAGTGWHVHNEDQVLFGKQTLSFGQYLLSGHFWGATAENWESEFLQMGFYVVLTCFLFQKGSAESKDPDDPDKDERPAHRKVGWLYKNSLSLVFVILFAISFVAHASGSWIEENEEREEHHLPKESMREFLSGSQFWFQSFQNWQSEFLAVLSVVTLTIFLRQKGSPESKGVTDSNWKTGK